MPGRQLPFWLVVPLTLLLAACEDQVAPEPAVLEVEVATDGASADLDADGYSVIVNGGTQRTISPNGRLILSDLEPGDHTIVVGGVESNCSHTGQNPQVVSVERGQVARALFTLACVPRRGDLRVAITTTGPEADPDGYLLEILQAGTGSVLFSGRVAIDDEISLEDIPAGWTEARLSDIAQNCGLTGQNPRGLQVAHAGRHAMGFDVACTTPLDIEFSISTTGEHAPAGYTISVLGEKGWASVEAPASGSARLTGLVPGHYTVFLLRADPSCDAEGNPRVLDGNLGGQHQLAFEVVCAAPRQLAFVNTADGDAEIYLANDDGTGRTRLTDNGATDEDPAWSPDGARLAFTSDRDGNPEVYLMNADGTSPIRLTAQLGADRLPTWSPDGTRILFVSDRDGNPEIYSIAPDGGGLARLTDHPGADTEPAWSPDGTRIAFIRDAVLHVMNADGTQVRPITFYPDYYYYYRFESGPAWSPDGTRIAFAIVWCDYYYGSGCWESNLVEVAPDGSAPPPPAVFGTAQPNLEGSAGWAQPAWYPDGRKVAFTSEGECVVTAPATCTRSVRLLRPGIEVLTIVDEFASGPAWRPMP